MLHKLINKLCQLQNILNKFIIKKYHNWNQLLIMMEIIVGLFWKFKNKEIIKTIKITRIKKTCLIILALIKKYH
jgi:hypothetical protein